MESCWFKLKQIYSPAPRIDSLGTSEETSPICLGHIIPDLKHLDQAINRGSIEPFPNGMNVWETPVIGLEWDDGTEKATIQKLFRQSLDDFCHFQFLESVFVEPTGPYVEKCLEHPSVAAHIDEAKKLYSGTWSIFMITGIMIARSSKEESVEAKDDIVWAIRLAKIYNDAANVVVGLQSWITESKGEAEVDVAAAVAAGGLEGFEVIEDKDIGASFVV
ncbi:hypothetical protein B7463_g1832, partial [Scytalidium lignicola]